MELAIARDEWKLRFDKLVETLCRFKEAGNFDKEAFEEVSEHLDKNNTHEEV